MIRFNIVAPTLHGIYPMTAGLPAKAEHTKSLISVLVPARDEAGSLPRLLPEICAALEGESFEIVVIDDASHDNTLDVVATIMTAHPEVRLIRNQSSAGKSGSLWIGALAARGEFGVTIDGDGQNDPQYLKPMIGILRSDSRVGLVAGQRKQRGGGSIKWLASKIANATRSRVLKDNTWDTACGLKAFRLEAFLALPYFETLHRFLPALFAADNWTVKHLDVIDRPREHGVSKYGVLDRLAVGIPDLFGVWWLSRRRRTRSRVQSTEISRTAERS